MRISDFLRDNRVPYTLLCRWLGKKSNTSSFYKRKMTGDIPVSSSEIDNICQVLTEHLRFPVTPDMFDTKVDTVRFE